jgi:hypothetical protein
MNEMNFSLTAGAKLGSRRNRVALATLAFAACLTVGAREAHATVTVYDHFESGGWTPFSSSSGLGGGGVGFFSGARSPTNVGYVWLSYAAASSDWATLYQTFSTTVTGPYIACAASVYLMPVNGFHGALELINPSTNSYVGYHALNLPSSNSWTNYAVTNSFTCTQSLLFRITATADGDSQEVYADDAEIQWIF